MKDYHSNPYEFWIDIYRWWCELIYAPVKKDEVQALRNCRNIDSKRIEVIEGILRDEGKL